MGVCVCVCAVTCVRYITVCIGAHGVEFCADVCIGAALVRSLRLNYTRICRFSITCY